MEPAEIPPGLPVLQRPALRRVRPAGWVEAIMRADLADGVVGYLDELAPDLLRDDEIYGRDRRGRSTPAKDLDAVGLRRRSQLLWWNSESQSNWRDGWVQHTMSVGDPVDRGTAAGWVDQMLGHQDADGYLGIYQVGLRYAQPGENAELWAQATLLRALLGYAEQGDDPAVVDAVRRAAERTLGALAEGWRPFGTEPSHAGTAHGLAFTDVLWQLWELTSEARYLDACRTLLQEYWDSPTTERDIARLGTAVDGFHGHGVHTYEHWRALCHARVAASHADAAGEPAAERPDVDWDRLCSAYRDRLDAALTPSGAPNGDEGCHPVGHASRTGYEYCSVVELLFSYGIAVQTTADPTDRANLAEAAEGIALNPGLGSRDPHGSGVAYLATDDLRELVGGTDDPSQTRYRFSPVHREAAVCCAPNLGRLLPAYLRQQWFVERGTLWVCQLGPGRATIATETGEVRVEQRADYPATFELRFRVVADTPARLTIRVRLPSWAAAPRVDGLAARRDGSWLVLDRTWHGRTDLVVPLGATPRPVPVRAGKSDGPAVLVTHGPLLMALALPGRREVTRRFADPRFAEILVHPTEPETAGQAAPAVDARPTARAEGVGPEEAALHAWLAPTPDGEPAWWGWRVHVPGLGDLVPMAATDLRRLTIAQKNR